MSTQHHSPAPQPGPPETTAGTVPASPQASVASARRIHLSEDWAATILGLALVALGLLSLLPEGLAA